MIKHIVAASLLLAGAYLTAGNAIACATPVSSMTCLRGCPSLRSNGGIQQQVVTFLRLSKVRASASTKS